MKLDIQKFAAEPPVSGVLIDQPALYEYHQNIKTYYADKIMTGDLSNLTTTDQSSLVNAINEINDKTGTDTGWINLTPATGTWTSLRYRRIGKLVQVEGYASSLTVSNGAAGTIATIPSEYRPSVTQYGTATGASGWIGRVYVVASNGNIAIDACKTTTGAYKGTGYAGFNIMYFID